MTDKNNISELIEILDRAQEAKDLLRSASSEQKDNALRFAADSLDSHRDALKVANSEDMDSALS